MLHFFCSLLQSFSNTNACTGFLRFIMSFFLCIKCISESHSFCRLSSSIKREILFLVFFAFSSQLINIKENVFVFINIIIITVVRSDFFSKMKNQTLLAHYNNDDKTFRSEDSTCTADPHLLLWRHIQLICGGRLILCNVLPFVEIAEPYWNRAKWRDFGMIGLLFLKPCIYK